MRYLKIFFCSALLYAQSGAPLNLNALDPDPAAAFDDITQGMHLLQNFTFGTNPDRAIGAIEQLATFFEPYGISGTTVINQEWERYQPFNTENFVFVDQALNLTATIAPKKGGLAPGGINSGQIWTKQTFRPGSDGFASHMAYAFEVRMQVPGGPGMWPAAWFYTKSPQPGMNDGSEIDNPEFFNMKGQNQFDWTGFQHGPGHGGRIYSLKGRNGIWHPDIDFSADYHNYQTLWTPDAVYKYVDGMLVDAELFKWTSPGAAQFGVNLAVGSSNPKLPGLQPTSLEQFPAVLSIAHIRIWAL
jgi:Glycosyl hydrolases family 16